MTLRPNDYDKNGDIIPDSVREDKGDLISRSALKEEFLKYKPYAVDFLSLIDNAKTVDYSRPSIEDIIGLMTDEELEHTTEITITTPKGKVVKFYSERQKGEWIETQRGIHVTDYKCSCCGRTVRDDTGYDVSADYPFCHCGADMRNKKITVYKTPVEEVAKGQPLSNSDEISKAMEKAKEKRGNNK